MSGDSIEEPHSEKCETDVLYKLEDIPPWYMSILLGIQHYLTMFSGAIAVPYLLSANICMEENSVYKGQLISATFFACGLTTLIQVTIGCRLPIIQGPSLGLLSSALAILSQPKWKCPSEFLFNNMTEDMKNEIWMSRMREIQGAIIVGSIVEVLIGLTGLIGFLMKWITPLSVMPTITLIGLSLFGEAARQASGQWAISSFTIILLTIVCQFLFNVKIPGCGYSKEQKCHIRWYPFFKFFPVLLTIALSWGLCAILTSTNVIHPNSPARTDLKLNSLQAIPWILVPYPGQWGMPTFSIGPALGVIAGFVASVIESVGDYFACARVSAAPSPPTHAVNRGIMIEGVGCIFAVLFGNGCGNTSFSQNLGAIAITKVASRRVIIFAGVLITFFGMIGKIGMLFVIIPDPIMGGIFCVMFAIITGVGISNLQYVNLNSSRNIFIIGFSLFMGLCIPSYLQNHPEALQTGSDVADQILGILLKTNMFVGGFLGCLLDNTIPATEVDRGVVAWREEKMKNSDNFEESSAVYDIPFVMECIKRISCFKYLPISPTYETKNINFKTACCVNKNKKPSNVSDGIELNRV